MTPRLVIVGAGAKAVAVAAKAAVLREMGVAAPDIVAVESRSVGANWNAVGGWTDGRHRLGTSPEKDVGFPYRSSMVPGRNAELDQRMAQVSWQSYLVDRGSFAEWVDRGKPAPTHDLWSDYLRWVAQKSQLDVVHGEVVRLSLDGTSWLVHTHDGCLRGDAVMITGPGRPDRSVLPGHHRVLSIAQFWQRAQQNQRIDADRVAVIGGGETAAAILDELLGHRVSAITVIAPQATLFTRGESYFENRLFSDPTEWPGLTVAERREVMMRTDRGVFSARVQDSLLADDRIRHLRGRVAHGVAADGRIRITLHTNHCGERLETVHGFDLVIDGSGADTSWFTALLGQDARDLIEVALTSPVTGDRLQHAVGADLALTGVWPKLFVPNLSGLAQGPGFPNLSCLGLLSDRILGADLRPAPPKNRRTHEHQPV